VSVKVIKARVTTAQNSAAFLGFGRWDCNTRAVTLQIHIKACPFPHSCPFVSLVPSFPAIQVTARAEPFKVMPVISIM